MAKKEVYEALQKLKHETTVDPTHHSLEAAILDQKVAGAMGDLPYAYVPVLNDDGKWALGIAVEDEAGYSPVTGMDFRTDQEARNFADGMNKHIGLDPYRTMEIVTSSMRGSVRPSY